MRGIFSLADGVFPCPGPWPGAGAGDGVLYCPFSSSTTAVRFRRYTNNQTRAITINTAAITPIAMPALAPALSPPPELEHVYDPLNTPSAASRSKSPQDMPEPEMLVSPLTWSMLGRDILHTNLASNMDGHGEGETEKRTYPNPPCRLRPLLTSSRLRKSTDSSALFPCISNPPLTSCNSLRVRFFNPSLSFTVTLPSTVCRSGR